MPLYIYSAKMKYNWKAWTLWDFTAGRASSSAPTKRQELNVLLLGSGIVCAFPSMYVCIVNYV